ncbi:MAG: hypothetical protein WA821_17550, partial [Anaerolineales bacterium]
HSPGRHFAPKNPEIGLKLALQLINSGARIGTVSLDLPPSGRAKLFKGLFSQCGELSFSTQSSIISIIGG